MLAETRTLFRLSAPILISQLAQASYGLIDTLMAGAVSPFDLAAVAVGAGIWLPFFLLTTGTLLATTPLIAAARGAGHADQVAAITHQGLYLALALGLIGGGLVWLSPWLLHQMGVPTHLHAAATLYLEGASWGMPAVGLFFVLRCYCEAQQRPVPVMVLSVLGLGLNVAFNQLFIYGSDAAGLPGMGIPALGGPGCGWATALVLWLMTGILGLYVMLTPAFARTRLLRHLSGPRLADQVRLLRLGLPIGLAIFFEVTAFSLVALMISPLGETAVAGHQVAMSITSLLFMVPLSLAIALTIRVGEAYGAQDLALIRFRARHGLVVGTAVAVLSGAVLWLGAPLFVRAYTDDLQVQALAAHLLLFAVAYQVSDAIQVGAAGCLRGVQNTRTPMILTLFAYWGLSLPVGYALGSTDLFGPARGPSGYWMGLVLGLTVAAILLTIALRRTLTQLAERPAFRIR